MKLSKNDRDVIAGIISTWTIVRVMKGDKEIWNCTGKETKTARDLKIVGGIKRIDVDQIMTEIALHFIGVKLE